MARAEGGGLVGIVFFFLADVPPPWAAESEGCCTFSCSVDADFCVPSFPFLPNGLGVIFARPLLRFLFVVTIT